MKYTKEYCENNKVAIIVDSENELGRLYKIFSNHTDHKKYESNHCYRFNTGIISYNENDGFYEEEGYEVIKAKDFLKQYSNEIINDYSIY